jgi:iron complex transport system ATP-binding protein
MADSLEVSRLSFSYEETRVLSDLSFAVGSAEFFVVIGPNGSGKTTLMKLAAGLLKAERSAIRIMGKDIRAYGRKELARRIAFVPQLVPTDFPFTVFEVVLFGRAPHQGSFGLESRDDLRLAEQAMAFTEVGHLARRRMDQLSGGERQRVFIARAICQEPEIMILDEPTASLDIAHQMRIMDLMEKMKGEKRITVIMVSHDVNLAAMYADTLLLLQDGRLAEWGAPEDVLRYETLERVYGCPLLVDESPLGRLPRVTPVPGRYMHHPPSSSP